MFSHKNKNRFLFTQTKSINCLVVKFNVFENYNSGRMSAITYKQSFQFPQVDRNSKTCFLSSKAGFQFYV